MFLGTPPLIPGFRSRGCRGNGTAEIGQRYFALSKSYQTTSHRGQTGGIGPAHRLKLAQIGQRLIDGAAKQIADNFFQRFAHGFGERIAERKADLRLAACVGEIVARAVEPIKASEEYYSDMLRLYLGVVARVLHHSGCWPPSLPFLIDCCQLRRFPKLLKLASDDPELHRRVTEAGEWIETQEGRKAVAGGAVRLQVVMGEAWRPVLAPRITPSSEHVAVSLARAMTERAVVLWRTYVDDMPKEAAMITRCGACMRLPI